MRQPRGFTLFELILVIAVIALVVSVTVAGFGDRQNDAAAADETQRLAVVMELAQDRAELAAEEWGLVFAPDSYRFLVYSPERKRWIAPRDGRFRERTLPAELRALWQIEGEQARASTGTRGNRRRNAAEQPDVLLLSSGESTPFRWTVEHTSGGRGWELASDGIGLPQVGVAGATRTDSKNATPSSRRPP